MVRIDKYEDILLSPKIICTQSHGMMVYEFREKLFQKSDCGLCVWSTHKVPIFLKSNLTKNFVRILWKLSIKFLKLVSSYGVVRVPTYIYLVFFFFYNFVKQKLNIG